jgi:succinoglycan biosynthesis transport protein ExoP
MACGEPKGPVSVLSEKRTNFSIGGVMQQQLEIQRESTVKDFLEVVFRRKWIVLGIVAVSSLSVVGFSLREAAAYESSAKVLVRRGEVQGVFNPYVRTLTWEEEIASQIEMVKSLVVLERANELLSELSPEGYEPIAEIDVGRVGSGVIGTSNVIWVTYLSSDPIFCEVAVNAIISAYREYYQKVRTPPEMDDFFSSELNSIKEEINYWLDYKERIFQEWDIIDINEQRRFLIQSLANYQDKYNELDQDIQEKRKVIQRLKELREMGIEQLSAATSGFIESQLEQQVVENLRNNLHSLRVEESELTARYTDENPEVQRVRKRIADMKSMLNEEISTQVIINENQLEVMLERERTLSGIMSRLTSESDDYPKKEIEVQRIESTLKQLNSNYLDLLESRLNAKMNIASNPEWTVTILSSATPAVRKKTRDYVRMAVGPVFSVLIALGLAFLIDSLDHSIKNISEAEESFGLPVLASLPENKTR